MKKLRKQLLEQIQSYDLEMPFSDDSVANQVHVVEELIKAINTHFEDALGEKDVEADDYDESENFADGLDRGFIRGYNQAIDEIKKKWYE